MSSENDFMRPVLLQIQKHLTIFCCSPEKVALCYEVMKDYISNAAYFLTVCPRVFECSQRREAFKIQLQINTHTPLPVQKRTRQSILGSVCLTLRELRES